MMLPSHKTMSPWQAIWYIGGVLLFPIGFAVIGLLLLNLGVRSDLAYLAALVAMPLIWFPLNIWLLRLASPPSYQRQVVVDIQDEQQPRPLIR